MRSKAGRFVIFLIVFYSFGAIVFFAQTVNEQKELRSGASVANPKVTVSLEEIKNHIFKLNAEYQQAVKMRDAKTIDRILSDDFVLVTGRGKVYSKADLLDTAREGKIIYERQEDESQTVRVWGDMAVITALLSAKGINDGKPFEYRLWFSDVYRLTPNGWRYVFAQSSIPLPN